MKRIILSAAIAITFCAAAFGQTATVSLLNQEDSTFYYVVDPGQLAGLTVGSPLLQSKVAGFFAASGGTGDFTALAPQAETKLENLTQGIHLLVGFFAQQDQDQFPVRVLSLQADSSAGERFYTLFADSPQLSVPRGVGRLIAFARGGEQTAAVAGSTTSAAATDAPAAATTPAAAADQLQTIATFAASYTPDVFTREKKGAFEVLPINGSRAWSLTGTEVTSLSGALDSKQLRLALSVPGGFSETVTYFFYVFPSRAAGQENALTLELQPRVNGSRGACLLWERGADAPRLVGSVITAAASVELDIDADQLGSMILAKTGGSTTIDFTAGWFDKALGTWEEFYYATFSTADIPATR
jgi:hypothetical protein